MAHEERRRRPRFSVSWPIWVLRQEKELARGETANISRSGAYFRSPVTAGLEPGMVVSVRIGMRDQDDVSRTVSGDAHVVRCDQEGEGAGIALHFKDEIDPFKRPG